jgi:hypothetical protein
MTKSILSIFKESTDVQPMYRLEQLKTHLGPYHANGVDLSEKFKVNPRANPDPLKDDSLKKALYTHPTVHKPLNWWMDNGVYTFNDLNQMKYWFTKPVIQWLIDEHDFVIIKKMIPVDASIIGEKQCITLKSEWDKTSGKKIKSI